MGDYILKNLGSKLAERISHSYYFYPYAPFRLIALLMLCCFSVIALILFYFIDLKESLYFYLFIISCIVLCFVMLIISNKSIKLKNQSSVIIIYMFFLNRNIQIENVRNIFRLTKTKYEFSKVEKSTTFYLYLKDDTKIRLSPDLLNYNKIQKKLLENFDYLIKGLANDFNLTIIGKEIDLNGNEK